MSTRSLMIHPSTLAVLPAPATVHSLAVLPALALTQPPCVLPRDATRTRHDDANSGKRLSAPCDSDSPNGRRNLYCPGDRTSFLDALSALRSNTEPEDELEARRMLCPVAISASLLNEYCVGIDR